MTYLALVASICLSVWVLNRWDWLIPIVWVAFAIGLFFI